MCVLTLGQTDYKILSLLLHIICEVYEKKMLCLVFMSSVPFTIYLSPISNSSNLNS